MKAILIVLGLLVVVGGGFMFLKKTDTTNNPDYQEGMTDGSSENTAIEEGASTGSTSGRTSSLADLTTKGAVRCDISIITGDPRMGDYKGVVYADGKGSFKTDIWNTKTPTNISYSLVSDPYLYIWTNQETRGVRRPVLKDASGRLSLPDSMGAPYDFSCASWNVSSSVFQTPSNISFSEMQEVKNPYTQ